MAGMEITITVDHGQLDCTTVHLLGGGGNRDGDLNDVVDEQQIEDAENRLVIIKKPNCCKRCRDNQDALLVIPIGNGLHPHCSCYAVEVDDNGNEIDIGAHDL